jgi:protein-S-isoprenylcysteine O-methyltransferase Ste14
MPWVLLLRWILRIAAGLFFWRMVTSRRRAYVNGTPPQRNAAARNVDSRAVAQAIREGVSIGWHVAAVAVLTVFASVLVTAGVATAVLSPRWLGGVLLGLAVVAVLALSAEGRVLGHEIAARRRRRHDEELRRIAP